MNKVVPREKWKDIEGYEGIYQVSNLGGIKTLNPRYKNKIILKPYGKSYSNIFLYKNNEKRRRYMVHRLVAKAFIPNPENKPMVNHINGVKADNHVSNLEWVTAKENIAHACKLGIGTVGERNGLSKITNEQARYIRKVYKPFDKEFGNKALSIKFGMNINNISNIITNKTYKNI